MLRSLAPKFGADATTEPAQVRYRRVQIGNQTVLPKISLFIIRWGFLNLQRYSQVREYLSTALVNSAHSVNNAQMGNTLTVTLDGRNVWSVNRVIKSWDFKLKKTVLPLAIRYVSPGRGIITLTAVRWPESTQYAHLVKELKRTEHLSMIQCVRNVLTEHFQAKLQQLKSVRTGQYVKRSNLNRLNQGALKLT
ncbi:uncharacterized protein [Hemitrygon akajei]|uniref:uncharacterized protein n=1 Tax=Hemitrygon akajei TaxID=2704970 RepID=UPI003BFA35B6